MSGIILPVMSPRTPPGKTREQIFRFVRDRLLDGFPPTVREIQDAFGFRAVQTVQAHLERLVTEGRLAKQKGKARGYTLPTGTPERPATIFVPLLGRVQAGDLNAAIEDCEGYVAVQQRGSEYSRTRPQEGSSAYHHNSPSQGALFALRVRGESMTGAGILPGDTVIVRSQPTANSGDIVVALIGDEATVKTLRIQRNQIILQPENPAFDPIIPEPDTCTILGKVIEIRRTL